MAEEAKDGCGVSAIKGVLVIGAGFFRVYAMVVLWQWFLVAPFGLPPIGLWHMCGIGSLLSLLKFKAYDPEESTRLMTWTHISAFCLAPPFVLAVGWAYRWLAF